MSKNRTPERVLYAIIEYQKEHEGRSPGVRDLQEMLGVGSTNTVIYNLIKLEAGGFISRVPGQARSIVVINKH